MVKYDERLDELKEKVKELVLNGKHVYIYGPDETELNDIFNTAAYCVRRDDQSILIDAGRDKVKENWFEYVYNTLLKICGEIDPKYDKWHENKNGSIDQKIKDLKKWANKNNYHIYIFMRDFDKMIDKYKLFAYDDLGTLRSLGAQDADEDKGMTYVLTTKLNLNDFITLQFNCTEVSDFATLFSANGAIGTLLGEREMADELEKIFKKAKTRKAIAQVTGGFPFLFFHAIKLVQEMTSEDTEINAGKLLEMLTGDRVIQESLQRIFHHLLRQGALPMDKGVLDENCCKRLYLLGLTNGIKETVWKSCVFERYLQVFWDDPNYESVRERMKEDRLKVGERPTNIDEYIWNEWEDIEIKLEKSNNNNNFRMRDSVSQAERKYWEFSKTVGEQTKIARVDYGDVATNYLGALEWFGRNKIRAFYDNNRNLFPKLIVNEGEFTHGNILHFMKTLIGTRNEAFDRISAFWDNRNGILHARKMPNFEELTMLRETFFFYIDYIYYGGVKDDIINAYKKNQKAFK